MNGSSKNAKGRSGEPRTIRVVIADDHSIIRQGIKTEIEKHADIELVGETSNGQDTIRLVDATQPDVLILDSHMPDLCGLQVMQRLQALAGPESTRAKWPPPVLIFSAYHDKQYVWSLLAAGAKGYLLKNETPEQIIAGIRQLSRGQTILSVSIQTMLVELITTLNCKLSTREMNVLTLVAKGLTNEEVAHALDITEGTVKHHLHNTCYKVPVLRTRAEAVAWAWINRIV